MRCCSPYHYQQCVTDRDGSGMGIASDAALRTYILAYDPSAYCKTATGTIPLTYSSCLLSNGKFIRKIKILQAAASSRRSRLLFWKTAVPQSEWARNYKIAKLKRFILKNRGKRGRIADTESKISALKNNLKVGLPLTHSACTVVDHINWRVLARIYQTKVKKVDDRRNKLKVELSSQYHINGADHWRVKFKGRYNY
ncbi:hypothetical protein CHS0354_001319 [Potamilus streckersoni]|uniref:Uncharacterized protein n=1 Tax=Potamilus streckersoni TaxID=2493646 RepID=A0AAE0VJQ9_9BIVA|nr:hypothetical protein CHS0354_001319 [Potamilus streckersoni]